MIPLFKVIMNPTVKEAVASVLMSGYVAQGPRVDEFEDLLMPWLGDRPVTVNSGTSALTLAYILAGVQPGTKVISTPMTCSATNLPLVNLGAEILWADVDPRTGLIDPESVAALLRENDVAAIVAVDWGGQPADYDALMELGAQSDAAVIEDAAHAFGAYYQNQPVGLTADYVAFSFQAIKHLTTGDGGALVVPPDQQDRARRLRWFGIDRQIKTKEFRGEVDIPEAGFKFHMNDIAATIGIENLRIIPDVLYAYRENARVYDRELDERFTRTAPDYDHTGAWWIYTLLLPSWRERDAFKSWMTEHGVQVSQVHWRNDRLSCMAPFRRDLPGVGEFANRMLCLPTHPETDAERVIAAANEFWA